jgi:NADH dehydrogenase [ubiquinone] 1 alpha subcomplex assembly factor 7
VSGEPYDPNARRDTPLALKLKERIQRDGPIRIDQYLEACLYDASHGYYVNKAAIGAKADFITAPEISQTFGELIGLWCVATWQQMGSPAAFNLVEFGPGRGTLMRDALRATRLRPEIRNAARVVLIETNATLKDAQRELLSGEDVPVSWCGKLVYANEPELPAIILANEFLDTEPIEQFVRSNTGWSIRTVGLDASGNLVFQTGPECDESTASDLDRRFSAARPGDICEVHSPAHDFGAAILSLPSRFAALMFDYGHMQSAPGDTLQAIRGHRYEHPLTSPGEADVTAQVDFAQISETFNSSRTAIDGPITQAEFLGRLGIIERASKLMSANPAKAGEIEAGVARLMAPTGMGSRFKAIGVRSSGLPTLPGF